MEHPIITLCDSETSGRALAGFNLPFDAPTDIHPTTPFYIIGENPSGRGYVYSSWFDRDLTLVEIREYFPEATIEELFSLQREWVAQSFRLRSNPLPVLRKAFPEFIFQYTDAKPTKGCFPSQTLIPPEGSTLWVNYMGEVWVKTLAEEKRYTPHVTAYIFESDVPPTCPVCGREWEVDVTHQGTKANGFLCMKSERCPMGHAGWSVSIIWDSARSQYGEYDPKTSMADYWREVE